MSTRTFVVGGAAAALEQDYEFLEELGRGGSSIVYLARDRVLGRTVAIKLIREGHSGDDETLARFEREAKVLATLDHPCIVSIHGARRLPDGSLALIMRHAKGETLRDALRTSGPMSIERVEAILRDIASGLKYLHDEGIVHRDLKPENIFLEAGTGRALISDFGIAKTVDTSSNVTLSGVVIGTPAYMSPEQIDGGELDGRSDLYGLGLVGHEMLVGRRPWDGETIYNIIYKQKNEDLPPLAEVRPDTPPHIQVALAGALAKAPEARWSDAGAFLAHLNAGTRARSRDVAAPNIELLGGDDAGGGSDEAQTILYRISASREPAPRPAAPRKRRRRRSATRPADPASRRPEEPAGPVPVPTAAVALTTTPGAPVPAEAALDEAVLRSIAEASAEPPASRRGRRSLAVAGVVIVLGGAVALWTGSLRQTLATDVTTLGSAGLDQSGGLSNARLAVPSIGDVTEEDAAPLVGDSAVSTPGINAAAGATEAAGTRGAMSEGGTVDPDNPTDEAAAVEEADTEPAPAARRRVSAPVPDAPEPVAVSGVTVGVGANLESVSFDPTLPVEQVRDANLLGLAARRATVDPVLQNRSEIIAALRAAASVHGGRGREVSVRLRVDATGDVVTAVIRESSQDAALDSAAIAIARQMRFSPARDTVGPLPTDIFIPITFLTNDD